MVRKLECETCTLSSGVGGVPGHILPCLGLRPGGMCENRGVNVLVCLFCHFLNIGRPVRIGSILSGVNVFNYK